MVTGGCISDRVELRRGPLGPAAYEVQLGVRGTPAVRAEDVTARMRVEETREGARLRLDIAGAEPVDASLTRAPGGELVLDAVQNVPPRSAGEADLAALVGQLDPPLPGRPVRLRDRWSSTRRIRTETIEASLTSRLRLLRFRRVAGTDTAELEGTVTGSLKTSGTSGVYKGTVDGRTTIWWSLDPGRLVASTTRLEWTITGSGRLVVSTSVEPA